MSFLFLGVCLNDSDRDVSSDLGMKGKLKRCLILTGTEKREIHKKTRSKMANLQVMDAIQLIPKLDGSLDSFEQFLMLIDAMHSGLHGGS